MWARKEHVLPPHTKISGIEMSNWTGPWGGLRSNENARRIGDTGMKSAAFLSAVPSTHLLSRRMRRAVYCGPPGQDGGELFDIYSPPPKNHGGFAQPGAAIGTKQRQFVHREGDWHRAVHVWLFHLSTNSILLQKRSEFKDTHPNKWDVSSAGHISHGDDSFKTAQKELEEELGMSSADLHFEKLFTAVAQFQSGPVDCNEYQDVYLIELNKERSAYNFNSLGETEVTAVEFMPIDEVEAALIRRDQAFVPRPASYRERFFEVLKQRSQN
eukprot:Plantae.Rhodophyta-Purpureofilum_apyrenoidigerum.ctg13808.p1 GENE.Plantae.Rhodophyta-Purpureofilum_apyrenoidigerum.ctg13808~~Plantae.Rhodophyta-Purpureofilum_apyrenoidigerum.ctg13808.p1  ORF type:complete len:278 (-),score=30.15 Plantae.Rhodophyta-Purpureofilum_apyrenoidigerum.ctg13808:80-889(-)